MSPVNNMSELIEHKGKDLNLNFCSLVFIELSWKHCLQGTLSSLIVKCQASPCPFYPSVDQPLDFNSSIL